LKNSLFVPNSQNLGDRKCIGDPSKSIVGHPDAILFLRILREGVFQQPQAITLIDPVGGEMASPIMMCPKGIRFTRVKTEETERSESAGSRLTRRYPFTRLSQSCGGWPEDAHG
jgi:hypothetical protein